MHSVSGMAFKHLPREYGDLPTEEDVVTAVAENDPREYPEEPKEESMPGPVSGDGQNGPVPVPEVEEDQEDPLGLF